MKKTYTYCLLQYHHSMILGEILNIGLLLYFPITNSLRFIHPENLLRLKNVYVNFPEKTILSYYDYFQARIAELNKTPDIFYEYELVNSLKEFVEKEFLAADSSMLQFNNYSKAIIYINDLEKLVMQLSKVYFPTDAIKLGDNINNTDIDKLKKNNKEEWIKPDFKNKIVKIDKDFIFLPNKNELSF